MLTHPGSGVHVIRQKYDDGYIYEYMVPRGVNLGPDVAYYAMPFFTAKMMRTYDDSGRHYVSIWVPHEEAEVYDDLFQTAASQPDFDYQSSPESPQEVLHEDERLLVARERYKTGWLYLVKVELGFPWPSFYQVPSLTPTRAAPIVAVERVGTGFITKFWVADNAPYAPAAA